AGPAVKPIALNMLSTLGTDEVVARSGVPVSGMGGISNWKDAAEFLLLGARSLQVCTAVMHYGFRIIEDLCDGLSNWMGSKGFRSISEFAGKSLPRISDFNNFDLSFRTVARINTDKCIKCDLCYVACNDTAHQCIDLVAADGTLVPPHAYDVRSNGKREATCTRPQPQVREHDCVGCRLCYNVCPVEGCIEMVELPSCFPATTWGEISQSRREVTESWDAMDHYRDELGIDIH
ncbi:MAG: NAD-dependent dihydropyrimidine dehydrogenase subunit PreA, partial [Candidatus Eremiobacteraeota bacterium]|nr:NAD-dependent dihydropyrimidine dehydrogenase subunit PreA [Candidatus Eremiobacteraeota bacterium]